jgi:ribosomal-protein-alanine N-acetyltransferase
MANIPAFETERLVLKGIALADAPFYKKHFVDYEIIRHLSAVVPWPYPENGVEEYITTMVLPHQGNGKWMWGIFLKNNISEIIGCVDLWKEGKPENRGFWLGRKFHGKGIMTEAVFPVIDFAFNNVGFEKMIFANAVGNTASRRVKEKTGCRLVGNKPTQFVDPALSESELWELTHDEWQQHKVLHPAQYSVKVSD